MRGRDTVGAYTRPTPATRPRSILRRTLLQGRTIALFGDSGSGKTTQAGEFIKWTYKNRKLRSRLNTCDKGGYGSIIPLEKLGVMEVNTLTPDDDPWIWTNNAVTGKDDGIGLEIFDSGTGLGEELLKAAANSPTQIGQQKTQRFGVTKGNQNLTVNLNNEAHYGLVQTYLLDAIWKSTWLTRRGVDVLWTFAVHRGEEQDRTQILGPKLAGKALTPAMPKWFAYTWRIASIPQEGGSPVHRLYLQEYPEMAGMGHSFGNARYPLDATTPLPPFIEPASIPHALDLIEGGQAEAEASIKAELEL